MSAIRSTWRRLGAALLGVMTLVVACGKPPPSAAALTPGNQAIIDQAAEAMIDERYEDVHDLLAELLEATPPDPDVQFLAGYAAYELRRFGEAATRLADAVQRKPELLPLSAGLGLSYHQLGRHDEARAALAATLAADPNALEAHYGLGLVALDIGDLGTAREHLSAVVRTRPDFLEARLALARLLEKEDRLQDALTTVEAFVAEWPSHEEGLYLQARLLTRLGRPDEAEAVLARRAEVYATQESIAALVEQVEAGGAGPQTYAEIVAYFIRLGDAGQAQAWIRRGLARHPDDLILLALESRLGDDPADR
jgi:tetratricopeptide (TPR) repeat protein